jgi:hypothetical protein
MGRRLGRVTYLDFQIGGSANFQNRGRLEFQNDGRSGIHTLSLGGAILAGNFTF